MKQNPITQYMYIIHVVPVYSIKIVSLVLRNPVPSFCTYVRPCTLFCQGAHLDILGNQFTHKDLGFHRHAMSVTTGKVDRNSVPVY